MGHIMEALEDAEKMLCKGIEELNKKGELNASSLEMLGNAVDAYKDIVEIREKEMGGSFESYGRRRRDSMGRFTDDGYGEGRRYRESYGEGYRESYREPYRESYRESYGDDREEERRRIEMKMRNSQNEREREMYRQKLEQL